MLPHFDFVLCCIAYVAPEVLGSGKSTQKSDVYSFGVVLWELIHRKKPFADLLSNRQGHLALIHQVTSGEQKLDFTELAMDSKEPGWLINDLIPMTTDCLNFEPSSRPTFEKIVAKLKRIQANK